MAAARTEALHSLSVGLDVRSGTEILGCLLQGQRDALGAIDGALPDIEKAAAEMADAIQRGGRLVYAAAGSSALMSLADAAELGGTFGLAPSQVRIFMAGGLPVDAHLPGDVEDDQAEAKAAADTVSSADVVIAVTASGTTAYPMTFARVARSHGARVICIANNEGAAIFEHADVSICLPTPPEVIAGSTRLGAGTAQKVVLNLMSTLMGIRLGHVHDGQMVNLIADNAKLRARARGIVSAISGVAESEAARCLEIAEGAVKPAIILAAGARGLDQATEILHRSKGNLRAAIESMRAKADKQN